MDKNLNDSINIFERYRKHDSVEKLFLSSKTSLFKESLKVHNKGNAKGYSLCESYLTGHRVNNIGEYGDQNS